MVFHSKLSTAMPPPEVCIGLAVTLAYDLLTSKCDYFSFVPKCTKVVNLVKCPQVVYNTLC